MVLIQSVTFWAEMLGSRGVGHVAIPPRWSVNQLLICPFKYNQTLIVVLYL